MDIIFFILIGLVAGWLAGLVMRGHGFGWLVNIIVGVLGALLGGWLAGVLGISIGSGLLTSLITAFVGAVLLLLIISLFKR